MPEGGTFPFSIAPVPDPRHRGMSEEAVLRSFQHHASQPAAEHRPGIDIDPVRSDLRLVGGRMAVNHDDAVVAVVPQEFLANPDQVLRVLSVERYPRPDAGMAEEIVAEADGQRQASQERPMRLRHFRRQLFRQGGELAVDEPRHRRHHAIGTQRRVAAIAEQHRSGFVRIVEETDQHLVMVAAQADDMAVGRDQRRQLSDHRR
jgi:hypothetical protein